MKKAAQAASSRYGCGSSRSEPEPLPPASDDGEALPDAIRRSYTSAEMDARRRRRRNASALRLALEEPERLATQNHKIYQQKMFLETTPVFV